MIATTLTFVAAAGLVAGLAALGPRKAAYSAFRHTISELGETGARDQHFVAFGLFLPVGLVLLAVAGLTFPAAPAVGALALCVAMGMSVPHRSLATPAHPGPVPRGRRFTTSPARWNTWAADLR